MKLLQLNVWRRYALVAILPFFIVPTGCTVAPTYRLPEDVQDRAFLTLSYSESSLIAGTVKVSKFQPPAICGKVHSNPETVFVLSRGNPLISNVNPDGVWIPANSKFSFVAISMRDGLPACGYSASFTPKADRAYKLKVLHGVRNSNSEAGNCSVVVEEIISGNSDTKESIPEESFQLESCVQSSA